ncbi:S8 family serine peptidase [Bdellovibrio sp. HCB337]|uniref:S8 family serine peptidase n=1 Tax=Bdellovibrio sp. HCB337 TaxID=3394358 RepID=UPI0039A692DA
MTKLSFAFVILFASFAQAQVFKNISTTQSGLGFTNHYDTSKISQPVKVAIFDKGFEGYKAEIGQSLPANTVYVPGPVKAPDDMKTEHGLRMAQIFTALATNNLRNSQVVHEFYLYNVYGHTNFKAAVDDAIKRGIDVISYSEVWEYGGNNDGRGFINAEVTRATQAGIIWVNAAGNFARTTYNGDINTVTDDWVKLPDQNNALSIRCEQNKAGKCLIKAVLSWNDFKDDVAPGTDKDLDLALTDDLLNIVQTSALHQSADENESRGGYSKYPREILTAELKPGVYFLRVKNRSKNFTAKDKLRITVDGESITMPRATPAESLLNPGDNPSVITVGALDSDRSSMSAKLGKPDIMAPSSMILQTGAEFRGSSNATAIVAAGVALLKAKNPNATKAEILSAISKPFSWDQGALSLNYLRFQPANGATCFNSREWPEAPDYIKQVLSVGGSLVETTVQYRIMVPFDPAILAANQQRQYMDDMVIVMPNGNYHIVRRLSPIPQGAVEIFQRPLETGLCNLPAKRTGKMFRM